MAGPGGVVEVMSAGRGEAGVRVSADYCAEAAEFTEIAEIVVRLRRERLWHELWRSAILDGAEVIDSAEAAGFSVGHAGEGQAAVGAGGNHRVDREGRHDAVW